MARLARAVFPGHPHHVTQRGNGRAQTFFSDEDYALYRDLLGTYCADAGVEIWSWVLMPNHVRLILVPADQDGLRRGNYGDTCNNPLTIHNWDAQGTRQAGGRYRRAPKSARRSPRRKLGALSVQCMVGQMVAEPGRRRPRH